MNSTNALFTAMLIVLVSIMKLSPIGMILVIGSIVALMMAAQVIAEYFGQEDER